MKPLAIAYVFSAVLLAGIWAENITLRLLSSLAVALMITAGTLDAIHHKRNADAKEPQ